MNRILGINRLISRKSIAAAGQIACRGNIMITTETKIIQLQQEPQHLP